MIYKTIFSFLILMSALTFVSFAQQPYTEEYYQNLYKQKMEEQKNPPAQQPQQPVNNDERTRQYYSLQFDKKGERTLEGFVKDIKEKDGEINFMVQTKHWGDIKCKLRKNTNFIPSRAAFKEGEYAIIKQLKNLQAVSVDIPAIWDAKKREFWFDSAIRK